MREIKPPNLGQNMESNSSIKPCNLANHQWCRVHHEWQIYHKQVKLRVKDTNTRKMTKQEIQQVFKVNENYLKLTTRSTYNHK